MQQNLPEQEAQNVKAKKFLVWLFIVSSFMIFAALTSGYIVYTAGSPMRGIKTILPHAFIYSTIIILVSSITMHMALLSGKKLQFSKQRMYLVITMLLGIAFFFTQFQAWNTLISRGIYFINDNASQSFIYVFTGAHLVHIIAGLIMILAALIGSLRNIPQVKNIFRLETTSIFWHFLDILWIYLYVFLLLNQ